MRMKQKMRLKKSARSKKPTRFRRAIGAWTILLAVLCVTGAAMLIAVARPSLPEDIATADPHPQKAAAAEMQAESKKPAASKAMIPRVTPRCRPKSSPVTITGCLELANETFRLQDTTGVNAPKTRSWKSGFLKKASRSIEVVDASRRLKLPSHVGQRVSVTGVLVDREMQGRSLQRVAASCK